MSSKLHGGTTTGDVLVAFLFAATCTLLLVAAIGLGGTRGWFGDRLLQSSGALLLGLVALHQMRRRARGSIAIEVWALAAITFLVPFFAWLGSNAIVTGSSPGATSLRSDLARAGVTLFSHSTAAEMAIWATLPAVSMLLASSLAGARGRSFLLATGVAIGIAETFVAVTQLSAKGFGWVRFTWPGDVNVYLATFANRNHLASMLAALLPICFIHAARPALVDRGEDRAAALLPRVMWASAGLILFTGIVASQSRSGLALALLGIGACSTLMLSPRMRLNALVALIAVGGAWLVFGGSELLGKTATRITDPLSTDSRLTYLSNSVDLASEFGIGGIGLGNFQRLYGLHMGEDGLAPTAVNHVHNDWAELVLETGWIGALALLLSTWIFVRRGLQLRHEFRARPTWTDAVAMDSRGATRAQSMRLAAWIGAALIAVHSLVDFPLRTSAVGCVFALLLAVAFSESTRSSSGRSRRSGRIIPRDHDYASGQTA